jgi:2-iminobutanoate/2-iminopropanoate deaminase
MNKVINTKLAPAPIGPYNQAIQAGDTLYISGQIPMNVETGVLVSDCVGNETHMVMKNLNAILLEAGYQFSDIVKCSIFLSDMGDFPVVNEAYGSYFTNNHPARETIQVSKLPLGVNVEISAIAVK